MLLKVTCLPLMYTLEVDQYSPLFYIRVHTLQLYYILLNSPQFANEILTL